MEPYTNAHTPWEPNSVKQVWALVNVRSVNEDAFLYECAANLMRRGFEGNDFSFAVLNMCQVADTILIHLMEESKDV